MAELDLETLLEQILEAAQELTGAEYAALGILDERRQGLERFITRGVDDATRTAIGDLPRGRGILGELIVHPVPLRLADVGEHPRSYGFPPGHPPMTSFLGVPVQIRGEAYGNLYLTEKTGAAEFNAEDEEAIVVLSAWAAIAIDNARLYQGFRERQEELERAVSGLETTTAIARAVGGETELDRVLELIVKRARALVEARVLVILLEDHGELLVSAVAGETDNGLVGMHIDPEETMAGQVMRQQSPLRLTEATAHLRARLSETLGARTALFVPLVFRGRAHGVLAAFDRLTGGPEFHAEDEHLMLSFAASAATAVATAKSVETDRLRHSVEASEQERKRWARELHDETLQGLGALRVLLSSALQSKSPEALEKTVRDAIGHIGSEIENLRTLITELRPAALDELGLEPAIQSLVQRTAAVQGLEIQTRVQLSSGDGRLGPELEQSVYRLVQEALTNISRHARASTVQVSIVERRGAIDVMVRDDGVGFDPASPVSGFGLAGMRERVQLTDGELSIDSAPGEGTTVKAVLPLPAGQSPSAATG